MIVMFPMLMSSTLSSDSLPAISKVLEKFILLYRTDSLSSAMRRFDLTKAAGAAAWHFLGASKEHDKGESDLLSDQIVSGGTKKGADPFYDLSNVGSSKDDKTKLDKEKWEKQKEDDLLDRVEAIGASKVDIKEPKKDMLSLEPTYVRMEHPKRGTYVIGVKVLPFPVSSEYNLIYYLANDVHSDLMVTYLKSAGRKLLRVIWTAMRGFHVPFMSKTISGDPKKDILWGETLFRHNIFCMINYNDTVSVDILKSPGIMRKMYTLGWNSLIFADDINRRAIFCMKEFAGLCSTIPYNIMGASFGKEYKQIFDSQEEVRKASASFFSLKKPSGLVIEQINLDQYLTTLFEREKEWKK